LKTRRGRLEPLERPDGRSLDGNRTFDGNRTVDGKPDVGSPLDADVHVPTGARNGARNVAASRTVDGKPDVGSPLDADVHVPTGARTGARNVAASRTVDASPACAGAAGRDNGRGDRLGRLDGPRPLALPPRDVLADCGDRR